LDGFGYRDEIIVYTPSSKAAYKTERTSE